MRKAGVIIVLVGFFMPVVLFFLSSGYHPGAGLLANIMEKEWTDEMKLHVWTVVIEETLYVREEDSEFEVYVPVGFPDPTAYKFSVCLSDSPTRGGTYPTCSLKLHHLGFLEPSGDF
jgi:hypothetical protein